MVAVRLGDLIGRRMLVLAIGTAVVVALPLAWALGLRGLAVSTVPGVLILAAVMIGVVAVARIWRPAAVVGILAVAATPLLFTAAAPRDVPLADGQAFLRDPFYDKALFNRDGAYLDAYQVAIDLTALVPKWNASPGMVVFWYSDGDELANLAESTYLWRYNAMQASSFPGMADLAPAERDQLLARAPRYLVLLAADASALEAGRSALAALPLPTVSTATAELTSGAKHLHVEMYELRAAPCDQSSLGTQAVWLGLPRCT
jgi:hypothetical protein